ncbi:ankyrin repeat-containing domain protein [Lasiosphaeria hispida]|uniref:Ankyrin repeat-containing domain protein n=1 Tax=Lasiosphaeria hispida TaxID=260671 RepID=A0AAJ0MHR1_9PEZI|nr:ankyrin repeat-containing domain protein [Lasiosphaeria hispida]
MLHGLAGPDPDDRLLWKEHWLPPGDDYLERPYSPSRIFGPHQDARIGLEDVATDLLTLAEDRPNNFYAFWASDIGGIIVKQALIIASEQAKYRWLLDATQAVIFFGTPHRASDTLSLDSSLHTIIEKYYNGVLGDWFPRRLNDFARAVENINNKFIPISHHFSIISYYQHRPVAFQYQVIVPKECATLGLENEITIGVVRAHHGMSQHMNRDEEYVAQTHLINTKIANWERFKHFMEILHLVSPACEFDGPSWLRWPKSTRGVERYFDNNALVDWLFSETPPSYMRIKVENTTDPIKLLASLAEAIWKTTEALCIACPTMDGNGSSSERARVYSSLLKQVLVQQPRVFLHIQQLVPNIIDALTGDVPSWKERALWLCLRTVMHSPIRVPTYGFLHIETPTSIEILREIDSDLQGTDSMFRLVLAVAKHVSLGLEDSKFFELDIDPDNLVDCKKNPAAISDNSLLAVHGSPGTYLTLQVLSLRLPSLGRSMLVALTWIAFATQPLTSGELDFAVAFDDPQKSTLWGVIDEFAVNLPKLLPDIVELSSGKVFLRISYAETRRFLSEWWQARSPDGVQSPHIYIAQKCLLLLRDIIPKPNTNVPQIAITEEVEEAALETSPSQGDNDAAKTDPTDPQAADNLPSQGKSTDFAAITTLNGVHRAFTEYAARNWIIHYELASPSDRPSHDTAGIFSSFVANDSAIQNWLTLLEYVSLPPPRDGYVEEKLIRVSDPMLRTLLDFRNFEHLKILSRLAIRPSSISGLGRLLIYVAENFDDTSSIVQSLYLHTSSIESDAIIRALATTTAPIHDRLAESVVPALEQKALAQVQLTAQVLGNSTISSELSKQLLSSTGESNDGAWFTDSLDRALEYGDEGIIDKLLSSKSAVENHVKLGEAASEEPRWTTLHSAANYGTLSAISKIWQAGLTHGINVPSLDHRQPLFIAASRGSAEVVQYLAARAAVDNVSGDLERTALHVASQHGHCRTIEALLTEKADVTIPDTEGNYALHLAIQRGRERAAELLVGHFPVVAEDGRHPSYQGTAIASRMTASDRAGSVFSNEEESPPLDDDGHGLEAAVDLDGEEQGGSIIVDDPSSAALNRANLEGITVLFEAADRDLPSVCKLLLERGADPNLVDDRDRVALHMAAKAGSVSITKDLLDKGSVTNQVSPGIESIPIHFACYRGHTAVAKLLMGSSDLTEKDTWGRTPLSAAACAGHLHAVTALSEACDAASKTEALVAAAKYGHRDVVEYLLDSGCPIDGTGDSSGTPLTSAAKTSNLRMMQLLLLRRADVEARDETGDQNRPLHNAALKGALEACKLLLDSGAELDVENGDEQSPLMGAIYWEHASVVRLLLERGAKLRLSARWARYSSVLDFAMGLSTFDVIAILIEFYVKGKHEDNLTRAKALTTAIRRGDRTVVDLILNIWFSSDVADEVSAVDAVHYAAYSGSVSFLVQILQHPAGKAVIDGEKPRAGTPLHAALSSGTSPSTVMEIVEKLLEMGADPKIVSGRWGTTLNAACVAGDSDIVKRLLGILPTEVICSVTGKYGTSIQSAIFGFRNATSDTTISILGTLEQYGVSPLVVGGRYFTPLHAAAHLKVPKEVVGWLADRSKRSLAVIDIVGRFPLNMAILRGDLEVVEELLSRLKKIASHSKPAKEHQSGLYKTRDKQGLTLLHYAAISTSAVVAEITSRLEEESRLGSWINERDLDGWTPLHWACRKPDREIVKLLLEKGADDMARTTEGWTPRHIAILHNNMDPEYLELLPETADTGGEGLPDGPGALFGGYCDVCYVKRCWRYHHCTSEDACCDDFDVCFKCYKHSAYIHYDGHTFVTHS